ncbi:MAG: 1-acyl-sn-glycerol-3-phosphate acyltransferase [Spirochaetia bacterium]
MHELPDDAAVAASAPPLDVQALFRAKNPRLARRIPPSAMRVLELIIHQRELRGFIERTRQCSGCEFVDAALSELRIEIEYEGIDRLPPSAHIVICANHPTGGIDGLVLMQLLCRRYGGLTLPANDLLLSLPGLADLVTPVDKYGSNARRVTRFEDMYRSAVPVLVFPAGLTARFRGGVLREYPWNKAFIKHARRAGRVVVPVHVSGRNSRRFYSIFRLRRALGIGVNLEMLLLVDELARRRGERVRVTIGTPVELGEARGPQHDQALAERLRRRVERGRV